MVSSCSISSEEEALRGAEAAAGRTAAAGPFTQQRREINRVLKVP
jgi:hypothetical protein